METQPILLVLLLLVSLFGGENASPLLDPVSITLLLLGLHWLALLVRHFMRRGLSADWAEVVHVIGLCATFALVIATHRQLLSNILALIIVIGLIIWFWRRGINLARSDRLDEYLITSFKIGFIVLLVVLILTAFFFSPLYMFGPNYTALHTAVGQGLTIYFLSGVLCLSFTRISIIRRENAYRAPGNSMIDPTRLWLVVLTLFWAVITAAALALETFSFGPVVAVLTWFWNGLGRLVGWFIGLIAPLLAFLLNLFAKLFPPVGRPLVPSGRNLPIINHPSPPPPLPADVINAIRLALLLILLAILILVIRAILRRLHVNTDNDSEEEVRENLSMRSILRDRLKPRQKSEVTVLEPLEPDSVRAHYRDLLQKLAEQDTQLAHLPNETPAEYEARLLALIKKSSSNIMQEREDGAPSDPELLDELTHAYVRERYGGKRTQLAHKAYLPAWISRFVKRLSSKDNS
jgi:hypothetical protein